MCAEPERRTFRYISNLPFEGASLSGSRTTNPEVDSPFQARCGRTQEEYTGTLTYSVEDYVQAVVDPWDPMPQPVEVESVLDVAPLHFAKHLVAGQSAEPLNPRVLSIGR